MQDLSSDDTQDIGEPPQGSDTQGSTFRTRKKRGIVSNDNSTFWDKGVVPYVYDDNLGKLFMFVHVCVDCFLFVFVFKSLRVCPCVCRLFFVCLFVFVFKSLRLSIPTFETVFLFACMSQLLFFFSFFFSLSLVLLCVPYINNNT